MGEIIQYIFYVNLYTCTCWCEISYMKWKYEYHCQEKEKELSSMIELVKKLEEDRKQVEKRVKDESQKQVIIMNFVLYSTSG